MPRKNANISNYHYRADIYDEEQKEIIISKYYFTMKDLCDEYCTSTFTIYKMMKNPDYKPQFKSIRNLNTIKFYKDYKPAIITTTRPNHLIFGELDDLS